MPKFGILQMKLGDKRIHEEALKQNKVTAVNEEYDLLTNGDIVLVASGAHPFALVKICDVIPEDEMIEPTFEDGKDFSVEILGYYKADKQLYPVIHDLGGAVPRDGTYLSLNDTSKSTYKLLSSWYELIKKDKKMDLEKYINLLKSNRNLILTGAPGTGKSYLAKEIAKYIGITAKPTKKNAQDIFSKIPVNTEVSTKAGYASIIIDGNKGTSLTYKYGSKGNTLTANFNSHVWDDTINNFKEHNLEKDSYNTAIQEYIKKEFSNFFIEFTQFHPSYDYTDFVEGLRPVKKGETLGFELKNGIFKDFCKKALIASKEDKEKQEPEKRKYVFIIDEINRAEVSKVFGELFYALDPGYRGIKGAVSTQYHNIQEGDTIFDDETGKFYVPENVYIIGTMNDIDRSVESFDFAMRRRFAWKEVKADDRISMWDGNIDNWKAEAKLKMGAINKIIENTEGLNSSYHIGPAYFLKLAHYDGNFQQLWDYHIGVILNEYLRGMPNAHEDFKNIKEAYDKAK